MFLNNGIHILIYAGLLFLVSQVCGRLAKYLGAPRLIGYLAAGILLGPSFVQVFPEELLMGKLALVTEVALALIAYSIGSSLKLEELRGLKKSILWITFFQAIFASVCVFIVAAWLMPKFIPGIQAGEGYRQTFLPMAFLLGAISAATAPAAIMSIVREYKAIGPFTTVLLGVVALDDALVLVFYSFAAVLAHSLISGDPLSIKTGLFDPVVTIFLSLVLGVAVAYLLKGIINYFSRRDTLLGLITGTVLLTSGLALTFGLSPLLANMVLGFMIRNFVEHVRSDEASDVIEDVEEPIYGAFFLIAGAHFNIWRLDEVIWLSLILMFARFAGKLIGTKAGAAAGSAPKVVKKYLGTALLPTAGVTIGLTLDASHAFSARLPELCSLMVSAMVGATLFNEFLTPFLLRRALFRTGEANSEP